MGGEKMKLSNGFKSKELMGGVAHTTSGQWYAEVNATGSRIRTKLSCPRGWIVCM